MADKENPNEKPPTGKAFSNEGKPTTEERPVSMPPRATSINESQTPTGATTQTIPVTEIAAQQQRAAGQQGPDAATGDDAKPENRTGAVSGTGFGTRVAPRLTETLQGTQPYGSDPDSLSAEEATFALRPTSTSEVMRAQANVEGYDKDQYDTRAAWIEAWPDTEKVSEVKSVGETPFGQTLVAVWGSDSNNEVVRQVRDKAEYYRILGMEREDVQWYYVNSALAKQYLPSPRSY